MVTLTPKANARLRIFNNILTVLVVLLGLYMIVTPFLPRASYWLRNNETATNTHYKRYLNQNNGNLPTPPNRHLIIPSIGLEAEIFEGDTSSTLKKGVWRRPKTSTPDKGGNTVLVAHRFVYHGEAPFYNLDKVNPGDTFSTFWEGAEYLYKVRETKIVEPSAIEIESNTADPIMTLYTCTPIWTAKQRLVIIADLAERTPIQ